MVHDETFSDFIAYPKFHFSPWQVNNILAACKILQTQTFALEVYIRILPLSSN